MKQSTRDKMNEWGYHRGYKDGIEFWRIQNDNYNDDNWVWCKIKDKPQGIVLTNVISERSKQKIKELLLQMRLLSKEETYITKLTKVDDIIERCIWFKSEEDYNTVLEMVLKNE